MNYEKQDNFELVYYDNESVIGVYVNNYLELAMLMVGRKIVLTIEYQDYMVDDFICDFWKLCNYGCNANDIKKLYLNFCDSFLYEKEEKEKLLKAMEVVGIEL